MKITEELAELIGIIIGDGNIHHNKKTRKYYIEITGNKEKEINYFNYISDLCNKILGKSGTIRICNDAIRIRIYSKKFVEFLIYELKMSYNQGKAYKTKIPNIILENKKFLPNCLRGIFDTDGTFFLANKGYRQDYPTLEISTCSENLAKQLEKTLNPEFRIKKRIQKNNKYILGRRFILALNGEKETQKWFNLIGSSNNYKLNKYEQFLTSKGLNNNF